ncbi:MAG: YdcF family protein, partial [Erysipelotrichaceae bacterium]|nr:YdcF family protein [Erysipelotrichaceae bacterium]
GIDENRIIVEEKSVNTRENFSNSVTLIKEYFGGKDPVIAFSTTNYHVFRSGILARQLGINAEGIGSPTKNYFWINAFVREFIATVLYGWKIHMAVTLINVFTNALMQQLLFISNNR